MVIGAFASSDTSITPQLVLKVNFFGSGLAALVGCATLPGVCAFAVASEHFTAACAAGVVTAKKDVAEIASAAKIPIFFNLLPSPIYQYLPILWVFSFSNYI
jgi:hypothetical protein